MRLLLCHHFTVVPCHLVLLYCTYIHKKNFMNCLSIGADDDDNLIAKWQMTTLIYLFTLYTTYMDSGEIKFNKGGPLGGRGGQIREVKESFRAENFFLFLIIHQTINLSSSLS